MGQGDCRHYIQFFDSFLATPETPLPSPPQGSGQEPYKIAANQASVISHQPLSKQKQLWEYVYFWTALHKCEMLLVLKYLRIALLPNFQPRLLHGAVIRWYPLFLFICSFCLLLLLFESFRCNQCISEFWYVCTVYFFHLPLYCAWTSWILCISFICCLIINLNV